jgi:hypothetical protein
VLRRAVLQRDPMGRDASARVDGQVNEVDLQTRRGASILPCCPYKPRCGGHLKSRVQPHQLSCHGAPWAAPRGVLCGLRHRRVTQAAFKASESPFPRAVATGIGGGTCRGARHQNGSRYRGCRSVGRRNEQIRARGTWRVREKPVPLRVACCALRVGVGTFGTMVTTGTGSLEHIDDRVEMPCEGVIEGAAELRHSVEEIVGGVG